MVKNLTQVKIIKSVVVAFVAIFLMLAAFKAFWTQITMTGLRKSLPASAHNIYEHEWDSPDDTKGAPYCALMRADMPEADMEEYIKTFKLKPLALMLPADSLSGFTWEDCVSPSSGKKPDWWDPTMDQNKTYLAYTGKSPDLDWIYAKWENGKVYAMAFNWPPAIQRSMNSSK